MSGISENWQIWRTGAGTAAFNMAADAALLELGPSLKTPLLRFYSWSEPAASFGYFQSFEQIALMTKLRPLVRRPTGGGLVPHDADWTYSLVFPPSHAWYALSAAESYRQVHDWLRRSFAALGRETQVAGESKKEGPGRCFVGHEKSDLLWGGIKIAGAAQRRSRAGLLIQGSLQPPVVAPARADWEAAMQRVAQEQFGVRWDVFAPGEIFLRRVAELAGSVYAHPETGRPRLGNPPEDPCRTKPKNAP